MRIDVLTIFPELFAVPLRVSLLGKAIDQGRLTVSVTDLREFAADRHRTTDDAPYGGGPGMVMKCEPLFAAVESLRGRWTRTWSATWPPKSVWSSSVPGTRAWTNA